MSRAEAQAFKERWRRVNEFERQELRQTPVEVRLRQFNTLLGWAHEFAWTEALAEGEAEVRARWVRLKQAYRG
jgi:hypothetical protein